MTLDEKYWSNRYIDQTATWDAGEVTPPLKEYIDQLTAKDMAIMIPGCGNSYEAGYLLARGFTNITLIDISIVLCKKLEATFATRLSSGIRIICADFFQHQGQYDLVLEQTFFCALPPSVRHDYVEKMHGLLKNNGKISGLLFNKEFIGGPPFGGTKEEYTSLFSKRFVIEILQDCYNSILPRKGTEWFIKLVKI